MLCLLILTGIGSCKKEILVTEKAPKNFVRTKEDTKVENIAFADVQKTLHKDIPGLISVGFDKLLNRNKISDITDEEDNELVFTTDSVKKISNANYTSFVFTLKLKSPRAVVFQNLTISKNKDGNVVAFVTTYKPDAKWIKAFRKGKKIPFSGVFKNSKLKGKWQKLNIKGGGNEIKMLLDCVDINSYTYMPYPCASLQHYPGMPGCQLTGNESAGYVVIISTQVDCAWINTSTQPGTGGSTNPPTTPTPPGTLDPCDEASVSSLPDDDTPVDPNEPVLLPCEETPVAPLEENLVAELTGKPDLLLDCQTAKWFKSLASYVPPQSVFDRISNLNTNSSSKPLFTNPFYVQQIKNAGGYQINLDRFEINVNSLPVVNGSRLTAVEFLSYIRGNLNNFIDNSVTTFQPYYDPNDNISDATRWNSNYPTGSILHLNISGDNGSVIVSNNLSNQWTVSTLRTPLDGAHPVSGNRTWGYDQRSDGSYVFYVTGADRLTTDGRALFQYLTGIPFAQADKLWQSYQTKVSDFVNMHAGQASVGISIKERPNYQLLKDYFDGKISLQQLKDSRGCI